MKFLRWDNFAKTATIGASCGDSEEPAFGELTYDTTGKNKCCCSGLPINLKVGKQFNLNKAVQTKVLLHCANNGLWLDTAWTTKVGESSGITFTDSMDCHKLYKEGNPVAHWGFGLWFKF